MIEKLTESDWDFLNGLFERADLEPASRRPWLTDSKIQPLPAGWGFVQDSHLVHREFVTQFHGKLKQEKRDESLKIHIEKLLADFATRETDRTRLTRIVQLLDSEYAATATAQIDKKSSLRSAAAESTAPDMGDVFRFAPLLREFGNHHSLVGAKPFAGKRVVLVLHFLRDLIPFIAAAENLGLDASRTVLFVKGKYGYPNKTLVTNWLSERGYRILLDTDIAAFYEELETSHPRNEPLLIVEDGGYLAPRIAKSETDLKRAVAGIVEQTSNGIRLLEDAIGKGVAPPFPFLSLPACQIKNQIEPPFIGRATTHTLQTMLSGVSLAGQAVGIIGFGAIGAQVATALKDLGVSRIKVFDMDDVKLAMARSVGCEHVESAEAAARDSFLLLGGSGRRTITESVIAELRDQAIVGSTSSIQVEIDVEWLEKTAVSHRAELRPGDQRIGTRYRLQDGREILVLANGTPLNFWNTEGMPDQIGDFIMTLLLLAAAELATGDHIRKGYDRRGIDGIAADYRVAKRFLDHWYR